MEYLKLTIKQKIWVSNISLGLIIVLLSGYTYLNAHLNNTIGDCLFPLVLFLAFSRYLIQDNIKVSRTLLIFFWVYFGIALFSVLLPPSEFTEFFLIKTPLYRIFCASLVVLLLDILPHERHFLRYVLTGTVLFLTIVSLFSSLNIFDKNTLAILTPLPIVDDPWNIKFFSSWLLLLTWGTVCLQWQNSFKGKCIALLILSLTTITILSLTSQGAKLALILSLILFVLLQIIPLKSNYKFYLLTSISFLLLPLICIAYFIAVPYDFNKYEKSFLKKIVINRIYVYHHSYKLFLDQPILGYGFRSAAALPFPNAKNLVKHWKEDTFPGHQPHNLTFLFLIEHGVIGILFLLGATYYFFNHVYKLSATSQSVFFALPLLLSFHVIFSFSYAIWHADIVLFVLFFIMMMRIVLSPSTEDTQ